MTITYDASGVKCLNCQAVVEDYTGHLNASEITLCDECYEENIEEYERRADVVHKVPKES